MILVRLKAGLGNQMFQYALGKRLALEWKDKLAFDLSWFDSIQEGETHRNIEIDSLCVTLDSVTAQERNKVQMSFFSKLYQKIRGRFDRNFFYTFHRNLLKKRKNILLDGYFQSYKYFDSIRDVLLEEFVLKNGYSEQGQHVARDIACIEQSVALHVRRGDFVTTCENWNGLCSQEYYDQAIRHIKNKFPDITIFIFSDDIEWVKQNMVFVDTVYFVSDPTFTPAEELQLMSLCKHQIIANSTFSWWAAWLNQNTSKIVVSPSQWLVVADINTKDLLPESWIQI